MDNKSNILLILDLDETLVYATDEQLEIKEDFTFDKYWIYKRPHLDDFLRSITQHFKIGIWSSAGDEYVNGIAQKIKPDTIEFEIVWAQSRCTQRRDSELDLYYWEKRLDKLKKRGFSLEQILIVDDTPHKAKYNFGNAIYVKAFTGNKNDNELKLLQNYLINLKYVDNVRKIEKRNWKREQDGLQQPQ